MNLECLAQCWEQYKQPINVHFGRIKEKIWASLVVQMIKNLPVMQETQVWSLDGEDPMEKGMAMNSSIFACRIPGTEEPSELQSMGSQRVRHDWATNTYKDKTCSKCLGNDGQQHHYSSNLRCYLLLFSHSVMSNSLWPHGLQHARLPCPSLPPGVCSNSCPLSQWRHPTISSSVTPFSSCLQFFPASRPFPMNQLFTSGSQSIGASASASVLPMNIQGWFPLGWTGLISLKSKGLSRVFSSTTVYYIF